MQTQKCHLLCLLRKPSFLIPSALLEIGMRKVSDISCSLVKLHQKDYDRPLVPSVPLMLPCGHVLIAVLEESERTFQQTPQVMNIEK